MPVSTQKEKFGGDNYINLDFPLKNRNPAAQKIVDEDPAKAETENQFLLTVINSIPDPLMVIDLDYKVQIMNVAASKNQAFIRNSCIYCHEVSHHPQTSCPDNRKNCPLELVKKSLSPITIVKEFPINSKKNRTFEIKASPIFNANNELCGIVETSKDITDHLNMEKTIYENYLDIHYLRYHGSLTNLPNISLFSDKLSQSIRKARKYNRRIAVFHLNLDRFKQINDSFGKSQGNKVLSNVATRLKSFLDKSVTLARMSADEFLIYSDNINVIDDATIIVQNLLQAFSKPYIINNQPINLTASIGISLFPQDGNNTDELLSKADTALHKAKDESLNSFQFYQKEMTANAFTYVMMESSLTKALQNEEFDLFYQPKISLEDRKLCGFEALIRWQHPSLGLITPDQFIPIAEESLLILEIGEWVIKQACKQAKIWSENNLNFNHIAINLSGKQFQDEVLDKKIKKILDDTQCPPEILEFEITESHLIENTSHTIDILNKIKAMGIKISIDDFGTGYSSLSQLNQLPIDTLKIDRSFTLELFKTKNSEAIILSIIALGKAMDINIVAEGIETEEQANFLKNAGCYQGQGYYFFQPLSQDKIHANFFKGLL